MLVMLAYGLRGLNSYTSELQTVVNEPIYNSNFFGQI